MAPKRKTGTSSQTASKKLKTKRGEADTAPAVVSFSIEHWAAELCSLLEKKCPGVSIELNPAKPRKGCFEIQDKKGAKYISLLNMPRPFKALRELDLNKVADDMAAQMDSSEPGDLSKAAAESATPKEAADVAAASKKA